MAKVFVVEDDLGLLGNLVEWLSGENYIVESAPDGQEALDNLLGAEYDVIVLDVDLPRVSGIEVCKRFRANKGTTPIIMLTGKDSISDREKGLDSGADDYLCKPFSMKELSARIRAQVRRSSKMYGDVLEVGDLVLDPVKHRLTKAGVELHLQPKHFSLLEFLMRHPDQVFSGEALLKRVWSTDSEATSEAIRTAIKAIRKKIDTDDDESQSLIQNIPRIGYRLKNTSS